MNPGMPEAWFARGSAYFFLNQYQKAISDLHEAIRLRPGYPEAVQLLQSTEELLKTQEQQKAVAKAPEPPPAPVAAPAPEPHPVPAPVIASTPPPVPVAASRTAEAHESLGRRLTQEKAYPKALAELNEAIRLKPDSPQALNARGYLYLLMRDFPHAINDLTEAIRLNPQYANAYLNRGAARKAAGDAAGAAADFQKATALARTNGWRNCTPADQ